MKRLTVYTCIAVAGLSLTACNRDQPGVPTPKTTQPDIITPAPVRPGDSTTPAVPGPNSAQPPMPEINKK